MSSTPAIVLLDVTEDDIRLGDRGMPWSCALARAATRQFGAVEVSVTDYNDITVTVEDEDGIRTEVEYVGPKAISAYLDRFDGYGDGTGRFKADVKPRTFRLKRVSPEPHVPEYR